MKNHRFWLNFISSTCFLFMAFAIGEEKIVGSPSEDDLPKNNWDISQPSYSVKARQVELELSEGTWMNIDVTPDGRSVLFDLLGDIYSIPIEGGRATEITSGHAWDIQPQVSPDGRYLSFTSDRSGAANIWVKDLLDLDEPEQQVTFEEFRLLNNASWHPTRNLLIAKKHFTTSRSLGTGEIWMYHAFLDGSLNREKMSGAVVVERPSKNYQKELGEPVFSHDGSSVFYTQNATPGDMFVYHEDSNDEVMVIKSFDLRTAKSKVVSGGPGGAVRPTPSPDGRKLAYVKRVRAQSRLFVQDLDSQKEIMLSDDLDPDMQETWGVQGLYPTMDWTPDSGSIVYWSGGKIWRVDVETKAKRQIPFKLKTQRTIYPSPKFRVEVSPDLYQTKMVRFASRSPVGEGIVFESLGRLFIKQPGQDPRSLTQDGVDGHEYSPVWDLKGKKIYFFRWQDDGLAELRVVSARGGRSRRVLEETGHFTELTINQSGEVLLFRKLDGNSFTRPTGGRNPGIYQVVISEGASTFVSDRGRGAHFGPENRIYAVERKRSTTGRGSDDAQTQLISMNSEGLDIKVHARSALASHIKVAPNGEAVAFLESGRLYVSEMPLTGGVHQLSPVENSQVAPSAFLTRRVSGEGGEYFGWGQADNSLSWSVGPEFNTTEVKYAFWSEVSPVIRRINLSMKVKADKPEGLVALTNARIITMNDAREVIESGTVLIDDNRILSLGSSQSVSIPAKAKVFDVGGKTILPGYIDAHAHGPYGRGDIIPEQNWSLLAHLALGVTTVHDPSSSAKRVFAASEYQRSGRIVGPRIFSTGEIVYGAKSVGYDPIDTMEDAQNVVERLKKQGAISIKNYNQPRREQRQMVIEAARQAGMLVVAEGGSLYHMDMNLVADGITGVEHNIPVMKVYEDVLKFWSETEVGYTPTLVVTYGGLTSEDYFYKETEVWKHPILSNFVPPSVLQPRSVRRVMAPEEDYRDDDSAAVAKLLMERGVIVNTGAHGQREGLATHWEIWSFARGGMSPLQALATATINPATYLGMENEIGSLEVGKLADLQIVDGDPLTDLRVTDRLTHVMLNGRLYQAVDLQELITGDRSTAPLWWHGEKHYEIR